MTKISYALNALQSLGVVAALILFGYAMKDRTSERHNRAWSMIAQAQRVVPEGPIILTNLGLRNALETLNDDGVPLKRIILPGAWLEGAKLSAADLRWSDLQRTEFNDADLSYANLGEANLGRSDLQGTDFTGANLRSTYLRKAKLKGASLRGAKLKGATLWDVSGLSCAQLTLAVDWELAFRDKELGCAAPIPEAWPS